VKASGAAGEVLIDRLRGEHARADAWSVDAPRPVAERPLGLVDRPVPEPGAGDVRVRVRARAASAGPTCTSPRATSRAPVRA
jgi:hypothetical protein